MLANPTLHVAEGGVTVRLPDGGTADGTPAILHDPDTLRSHVFLGETLITTYNGCASWYDAATRFDADYPVIDGGCTWG